MLRSAVAFGVLAALITIAPGPDFVLVVRTALAADHRRAIAASLGICSGLLAWSVVSAAGITALLTASKIAFTALRLAGAAYLVWLGIDAIRHAGRGVSGDEAPPLRSPWHAYRTGLINNALNPKIGVFYVTVVPTFIPDGAPVLATSLLFGWIHVLLGIVWLALVALLVERLRRLVLRRRTQQRLEQAAGVTLLGLGVTVAIDAAR